MPRFRQLAAQFVFDDSGQDLIEYALLTAAVGIAGVLIFGVMRTNMENVYVSWTGSVQSNWEPPPPQ